MDVNDKFAGDKKRSPPIKVLSSQLREGKEHTAPNGKIECTVKRLGQGKTVPLKVSVVWMQGTVLEVKSDNSTTVLLLDETGTFLVNGVSNIPKGKPCLFPGKYVMVMGVLQSCSPEPVLRAVKMADLSLNDVIHRRMWKFEVQDLQQTL
ncbi:recQ-mediated genome instability protein 2 [Megalops cyprinoides]|uniref:recQ-mediated genome instability protein 2 n=1 Tax=Megalops cyprinoides TaxID=118141 RepID=UPI00186502B9|nr:recQ-mediated genome instability protein 2 [Megalops cyprinoides]